jgi:hypothetical protein
MLIKIMDQDIYLVFSQTYTIPSRIIKIFTRKPYSHVSLSFDNKFNCMYSFGRKSLRNFLNGGFVRENIKQGIFTFNSKAHCIIYKLKVTNDQYLRIKEYIKNIELNNYKYNMLGAILIPFNIKLTRKNKYYCSEFIYNLLCYAKVIEEDKKIIVPHYLMNINNLKLYYQGIIKEIK